MNPFVVESLPIDDIPVDMRPREVSSVRIVREGRNYRERERQSGLGQIPTEYRVESSVSWQRVIDSIPMMVITLGAFVLIYALLSRR